MLTRITAQAFGMLVFLTPILVGLSANRVGTVHHSAASPGFRATSAGRVEGGCELNANEVALIQAVVSQRFNATAGCKFENLTLAAVLGN